MSHMVAVKTIQSGYCVQSTGRRVVSRFSLVLCGVGRSRTAGMDRSGLESAIARELYVWILYHGSFMPVGDGIQPGDVTSRLLCSAGKTRQLAILSWLI